MVGLKTFWITLFALLFLGACVPQTKQSKCSADEAFNAQLRTCVPVVPGPTEFINIINPAPSSTLSRYVNDAINPINFSIGISNPYGLAYSVTWERLYNGTTYSITPTTPTTYNIVPSGMSGGGTQTGIHVISVKLKDSNNQIVDTHNFEVLLGSTPTPYINTFIPTDNIVSLTPVSAVQPFSLSIKNNGSIVTSFRTEWRVYKNGVNLTAYDFNQVFASTVSTATHASNYNLFDPSAIGIGSYTVRAKLVDTGTSEVADEQQWLVTIAHPPFSKITARDLREGMAVPSYATVTTAYNGVSYNSNDTYNFMPVSTVTPAANTNQSDFCVTVADGEGAYPAGAGVKVNWYLDGTTLVSTAITTALDSTVCLADTGAPANIVFNNVNPTDTTTHSITARVFDISAGNVEYTYTTADMDASVAGAISWPINVKPQNDKPTVAFGAQAGLSLCTLNALGDTYSNCKVPSDTDFTVSLTLTGDDFYYTAFDETKFEYDFILYRNSVPVTTSECTKVVSGDADAPVNDVAGLNYQCKFNLRSWDSTGPIAVTTGTWTIRATINDTGSPITPASGAVSRTMTWNLTATETETAPLPVITHSGATIDEGTALVFNLSVTDAERDNFKYDILYCKDDAVADPTCTNTGSLIGLTTITRSASTNPLVTAVSKVLPENFLLNLPLIPCNATARNATCAVRFKAFVEDIPLTVTGLNANSAIVSVTIRNINPLPALNYALALPNPTTYSALPANALVGNAVSFAAGGSGVITDTSAATEEGALNHRYQWYIKPTTLVVTDTPIDSATGVNLVWTPSLMKETNLGTENPISVYLCVEDQPAAVVTTPNPTDSVCNKANPWTATVRDNIVTMQDLTITAGTTLANNGTDIGTEVAVWYDTPAALSGVTASAVYMAMIGNDGNIHVKKALMSSTGQMIPDSNSTIVSFPPLSSGTADNIQNLSITGTGSSLYIAYVAASSFSPLANHPQIRRIDITNGKVDAHAADTLVGYDRKFGFDYDGIDIDISLCSAGCSITNPKDGSVPTITFAPAGTITGSITITTPKGAELINFAPGNVADTICGNCTATDMATSLATTINRNVGNLAGLSATSAAGVVSIFGSLAGDYIDTSTNLTFSNVSPQIGSIFVAGGKWYLPFINSSLAGVRQDKISIFSGTIDQQISLAGGVTIANPAGGIDLDTIVTASRLSSYFNGTSLMLGIVTKVGSKGIIYEIDPVTNTVPRTVNILATKVLTDIQLAASSTYVFAAAKTTANEIWQGVYSSVLAIQKEFNFTDLTYVDGVTGNIFNYADLSSYTLVPNGAEAYMVGSSKDSGLYQLYLGRVYNNGTNWVLTCKDCKMASFQAQQLSQYVTVSAAPIRVKAGAADPLYRTSTDGSVTNQGIRNLLFVGYGQWDGGTQTNPMVGVMNIEAEQIGATNIHLGTAPNGDSGFYRPPFIKN